MEGVPIMVGIGSDHFIPSDWWGDGLGFVDAFLRRFGSGLEGGGASYDGGDEDGKELHG
jgi:hypothetical protein